MTERDLVPVATYMRVSTRDPERQSLASQNHALQQFARVRGFRIAESFSDRMSGAKSSRPGLDKLLASLAGFPSRGIAAVVVYKLDRLSRGGIFDLLQTTLLFNQVGVDLISATEPIDTSTAYGRLYFSVAACLAEIERDNLRERVIDGMAAARAAGKHCGRPPANVLPEDLALMVELRERGLSWSKIHQAVNEKYSIGTIRNRVAIAMNDKAIAQKSKIFRKGDPDAENC